MTKRVPTKLGSKTPGISPPFSSAIPTLAATGRIGATTGFAVFSARTAPVPGSANGAGWRPDDKAAEASGVSTVQNSVIKSVFHPVYFHPPFHMLLLQDIFIHRHHPCYKCSQGDRDMFAARIVNIKMIGRITIIRQQADKPAFFNFILNQILIYKGNT